MQRYNHQARHADHCLTEHGPTKASSTSSQPILGKEAVCNERPEDLNWLSSPAAWVGPSHTQSILPKLAHCRQKLQDWALEVSYEVPSNNNKQTKNQQKVITQMRLAAKSSP
jgi:hypothetical protein